MKKTLLTTVMVICLTTFAVGKAVSWNQNPESFVDDYEVCISTSVITPTVCTPAIPIASTGGALSYTVPITSLVSNTLYYVGVRAKRTDTGQVSDWSFQTASSESATFYIDLSNPSSPSRELNVVIDYSNGTVTIE